MPEGNRATKHFEKLNLTAYTSWYDNDTLKYLIHSIPKAFPHLRYVFTYASKDSFLKEFQQLVLLSNDLKQPALFICMEPGQVNISHFVVGLFYQGQIAIINPVGLTAHRDFYQYLKTLHEQGLVNQFYVSKTIIQRDPNGLMSCGPLCVELLCHFSQLPMQTLSSLFQSDDIQVKENIELRTVDISTLLAPSLQPCLSLEDEAYQQYIEALRQEHQGLLEALTQNAAEQAINGDEQIIMAQLVVEKKGIMGIINGTTYQKLKGEGLSKLPKFMHPNHFQHNENNRGIQKTDKKRISDKISKLIILDSVVPHETKGDGDCPFHAIFGEWEERAKIFVCKDVALKRQYVAECIKKCKTDESLFSLVKEAITNLIMEGKPVGGPNITQAQVAYRDSAIKSHDPINWSTFEAVISQFNSLQAYIENFTTNYIQNYEVKKEKKIEQGNLNALTRNAETRFMNCLNEDGGRLKECIARTPKLYQAFRAYEKSKKSIDWDKILNDQNIIDEYAAFIGKLGNWLLPIELHIIAKAFNISVSYHQDGISPIIYNPEARGSEQPVPVYFNGTNHYQKMASSQAVTQYEQAKISETNHYTEQPKNKKQLEGGLERSYFFDVNEIEENKKRVQPGYLKTIKYAPHQDDKLFLNKYTTNRAAQHFKELNLTAYTSWYDNDTLKYLVHSIPKFFPHLRYVFTYASQTSFLQEFQQLVLTSIGLKQPILFICIEPGQAQVSHLVVGVFYQGQLVIINPIGMTAHRDFYQLLKTLQEQNLVNQFYVSKTIIQRDLNGLMSCGPLCVELMRHFSQSPLQTVLSLFRSDETQIKEEIKLGIIDISTLLSASLQSCLSLEGEAYQQTIEALRWEHQGMLEALTEKEAEHILNIDEQMIMAQLVVEKKTILELLAKDVYQRLAKKMYLNINQNNTDKIIGEQHNNNASQNPLKKPENIGISPLKKQDDSSFPSSSVTGYNEKVCTKAIRNLLIKSILPTLTHQPYQKPSCFICYARGVPKHEKFIQKKLAEHLKHAGINVQLDVWQNRAGRWISEHTKRIATSDAVIVACSEKLMEKYNNMQGGAVVSLELEQVFTRLQNEKHKGTILPILLDGTEKTAKPHFLHGNIHIDFADSLQYTVQLLVLLERIYATKDAQAEAAIQVLQVQHSELVKQIKKGKMEVELAQLIAEECRSMQRVKASKQANCSNQLNIARDQFILFEHIIGITNDYITERIFDKVDDKTISRVDQLEQISDLLKENEQTIVIVHGRSGIGKSVTLKQYVEYKKFKSGQYIYCPARSFTDEYVNTLQLGQVKMLVLDTIDHLIEQDTLTKLTPSIQQCIKYNIHLVLLIKSDTKQTLYDFIKAYKDPEEVEITPLRSESVFQHFPQLKRYETIDSISQTLRIPFYLSHALGLQEKSLLPIDLTQKELENYLIEESLKLDGLGLDDKLTLLRAVIYQSLQRNEPAVNVKTKANILKSLKTSHVLLELSHTNQLMIRHDLYQEWVISKLLDEEFSLNLSTKGDFNALLAFPSVFHLKKWLKNNIKRINSYLISIHEYDLTPVSQMKLLAVLSEIALDSPLEVMNGVATALFSLWKQLNEMLLQTNLDTLAKALIKVSPYLTDEQVSSLFSIISATTYQENSNKFKKRSKIELALINASLDPVSCEPLCQSHPQKVLSVIEKVYYDTREQPTSKSKLYGFIKNQVELFSFYPASALQGPFFYLLHYHEVTFLPNIIGLIDRYCIKAIESSICTIPIYKDDEWTTTQDKTEEFKLESKNHEYLVKGNQTIWSIYRGGSLEAPKIVLCALMALEKWLYDQLNQNKAIDRLFEQVIISCKTVAAISVLASLCTAFPEKCKAYSSLFIR